MSLVGFYVEVVRVLEDLEAPYMLVGAFAASTYGLSRATFDIDIIVDLQELHFEALAKRFPLPRFYADPEQMRDSTCMGIMFNLIDTSRGAKADLVPLSREPDYLLAFSRRVRRVFQDELGESFQAWCARPEDIVIGKLAAWKEGRSGKHPNDIYSLLLFDFKGFNDLGVDTDSIGLYAARMGDEVEDLWLDLLERARTETRD